ncbi:MAG TPA: hypothetical protein VKV35_12835 [Streptosporangiaceae bacterium]|nr:hypothetical protein [Streptosporangiaceae bacterium]
MSFIPKHRAAVLGLLALSLAGCGGAAAATHVGGTKPPPPATAGAHMPTRQTPAAVKPSHPAMAPAPAGNPIPQGNGGDHDVDNNGGPSDGDGSL